MFGKNKEFDCFELFGKNLGALNQRQDIETSLDSVNNIKVKIVLSLGLERVQVV